MSTKCHFLRREVTFLGHVVSSDAEKVKPVTTWSVTLNVKELQSWLDLTCYYRTFTLRFSILTCHQSTSLRSHMRCACALLVSAERFASLVVIRKLVFSCILFVNLQQASVYLASWRSTETVGVVPFLYYSFCCTVLGFPSENECWRWIINRPCGCRHRRTGTASVVDTATNKHILDSLKNIDQTMG